LTGRTGRSDRTRPVLNPSCCLSSVNDRTQKRRLTGCSEDTVHASGVALKFVQDLKKNLSRGGGTTGRTGVSDHHRSDAFDREKRSLELSGL
jgi:hypothetical protein